MKTTSAFLLSAAVLTLAAAMPAQAAWQPQKPIEFVATAGPAIALIQSRLPQLQWDIRGGGAHLLVARDQFEGLRVEDRELLLDPDREVGGLRESIRGEV